MSHLNYKFARMKRLHQIVACVFLILWVPTTTHCLWEEQFGGDVFKCASKSADKSDCANGGDSCSTLETGRYRIPDGALVVPTPMLALFLFEIPPPTFNLSEQVIAETAAPDEIPRSWLFFSRTASPPRAPSFVF